MMAYGLSLKNIEGKEIWYGKERSLVFFSKGVDTFTNRGKYVSTGYFGKNPPLVYAHFPNGEGYSSGVTRKKSSGEWEFSIYIDWFLSHNILAEWYVFTPMGEVNSYSSHGINIFNEDGILAYSSDFLPLRTLYGGVFTRTGGGVFSTPNKPKKFAIKIIPATLWSWSGSQFQGGFSVTVRLLRHFNDRIELGHKRYAGNFPSPGVLYASTGSWDSVYVDAIDGGYYD